MDTTTALLRELDDVDEAIAIYSAEDRLVAFNKRYREWRSAIGGDVRVGASWLDLVTESVRCGAIPEAKGREEQWLEQRSKARGAYSIVRKVTDGRAFKVNEKRMANGGIAVVWTDITEFIGALEERVKDSEGDQERLLKLGALVADVAHDFNNAMQGIVGSLELLSKTMPFDNERNRQLLSNAVLSARHGMAIAERLLSDTRRKPVAQNPIDVGATLEDLLPVLRDTLNNLIELRIMAPPNFFFAAVEPLKLEAALINLVLNARDAIQESGSITISLHHKSSSEASKPDGGRYIVLTVTDSGIGMDNATLARASEPMFTTKEIGKGTGLGLAAVKQFTQSVGGKLVLHSTVGIGTSVELWLPASPQFDGD